MIKKIWANPYFVYGNLLYVFFLLGFILYTHPDKEVLHKYSFHYFEALLIQAALWVPFNVVLLFLISDSISFSIGGTQHHLRFAARALLKVVVVVILLIAVFLTGELYLRLNPKPLVEDFH